MVPTGIKITKKKKGFLFPGLLLILILVGLGYFQAAWAIDPRTSELIEGAKKEGKLVLYSSMGLGDVDTMAKWFQEKYPFIKVEYTKASRPQLLIKVLNEAMAKKYVFDVVQQGTFEISPLKKKGLLEKYSSPETRTYQENRKDPEGYYSIFYLSIFPMIYNTKLVSPANAPKSYEDLLNPRWKGKLALESGGGGTSWYICMMKKMGEQKGEAFMRELVKQRVTLRPGASLVITLVTAGEIPLSITSAGNRVEAMKDAGAPIEWVRTDPMFTTQSAIAMSSHASHPNSAKLFIDLMLSKEGQQLIRDMHNIPARSDVEPDPPRLVKGLNLFPYPPEWADDYERYSKKMFEIFR